MVAQNVATNVVSPQTFTLVCFAILLFLIALAVLGVILYVHKNNNIMKETIKEQNHTEFESFKSTIVNMNRGLVDSVVDILKDQDSGYKKPKNKAEEAKINQEELLNTFARLRDIIKEDLYATMKSTSACRTALYLFHNGTRSTQGISFLKISCIGEKVVIGSGIKEQILNHASMPINLFDNMFEKLMENGKYIIMNDEETMASSRSKFISATKIRYSIASAIYDHSNNILGFILAEFDHPYDKNTSDVETVDLKAFADKIAPLLSFSEYADLTLQNTTIHDVQHE